MPLRASPVRGIARAQGNAGCQRYRPCGLRHPVPSRQPKVANPDDALQSGSRLAGLMSRWSIPCPCGFAVPGGLYTDPGDTLHSAAPTARDFDTFR